MKTKSIVYIVVGMMLSLVVGIFISYLATKEVYDKKEIICDKCENFSDISGVVSFGDIDWLNSHLILAATNFADTMDKNYTGIPNDSDRIEWSCMAARDEGLGEELITRATDSGSGKAYYIKKNLANEISLKVFGKTIDEDKISQNDIYNDEEYACNLPSGWMGIEPVMKKLYYDSNTKQYTLIFTSNTINSDFAYIYRMKNNQMIFVSLKKQ